MSTCTTCLTLAPGLIWCAAQDRIVLPDNTTRLLLPEERKLVPPFVIWSKGDDGVVHTRAAYTLASVKNLWGRLHNGRTVKGLPPLSGQPGLRAGWFRTGGYYGANW